MLKILILAYDFPPYVSVGGLRPYNWYKYFHKFGVYPIVITRQWSNLHGNLLDYISPSNTNDIIVEKSEQGTIIKTPYVPNFSNRLMLKYQDSKFKLLRKLISAYYEFAQFIFLIGPKSKLYFAAKNYLKNNKVDCIIASGDPFILFKYASKLGEKFDIPWIADYRDPWSENFGNRKHSVLRIFNAFFEKKTLKNVHSITTVSEFVRNKVFKIKQDKHIYIMPNGFDPEAIKSIEQIKQQNEVLSVAFIGTIYRWHPIKSFFSVISDLLKNKKIKILVKFYGINAGDEIKKLLEISYPDIRENVTIFPKIPNQVLLEELAKNNVMLLFNYYSCMGTKIYDYLGIHRKIILCYTDDDEANELKNKFYTIDESDSPDKNLQERLILETQSGIAVKNANHLKQVLIDLHNEFNSKGFIECNSVDVEQYSREIQVRKLADIIHSIVVVQKDKVYQQCACCLMDTSDPEISFNEKGVCNHCTDYFEKTSKRAYQGDASDLKLARLVEKIKRAGRRHDYDCVIGISGGVDSLYTAYLAKKMGLRLLCVHLDNGWNSELATHNIEKILKKLELELITVVLVWEEFRDLQLSFLKASVPEAETPTDIAIPAALHRIAAHHNIKYIFSGGNFATEGILPKSWHYNAKDMRYLRAIHKRFGSKKLKTFPTFGFVKEMYYKYFKGIRMIYPLNYIPYNKKNALELLEKELQWENYGGKHHESLYTKFIQSYLLPEKFNIDYRKATYSTQICAGEITREYALHDMAKKTYNPLMIEEDKEYVCKKLTISPAELQQIIDSPPRKYSDYPNNKKLLEFIYRVYRYLNKAKQ